MAPSSSPTKPGGDDDDEPVVDPTSEQQSEDVVMEEAAAEGGADGGATEAMGGGRDDDRTPTGGDGSGENDDDDDAMDAEDEEDEDAEADGGAPGTDAAAAAAADVPPTASSEGAGADDEDDSDVEAAPSFDELRDSPPKKKMELTQGEGVAAQPMDVVSQPAPPPQRPHGGSKPRQPPPPPGEPPAAKAPAAAAPADVSSDPSRDDEAGAAGDDDDAVMDVDLGAPVDSAASPEKLQGEQDSSSPEKSSTPSPSPPAVAKEGGGGGKAVTPPPLTDAPPQQQQQQQTNESSSTQVEDEGGEGDGDEDDEGQPSPATTEATLKLIEMLRSEEVSDRIAAMNQLDAVAVGLGAARTREELLPFLTESVDDEDEVLVVMAEAVAGLLPHLGGTRHAHLLLGPLELLLTVEESTVREKAVESTRAVAASLSPESYATSYVDMIGRLATKEWFTARISACGLIADGFDKFTPEQQEEYMDLFAKLCRDDAPMVRRVASHNLGTLVTNVVSARGGAGAAGSDQAWGPDGMISSVLLPLYEELARNDQDSVRLQTSENCIAFGRAIAAAAAGDGSREGENGDGDGMEATLEGDATTATVSEGAGSGGGGPRMTRVQQEELTKRILPLLVATIDDRSWRVRWTAASKFAEAVAAFSDLPGAAESLVPAYEKLLQDPEAEVRTAATFNLADVAKCNGVRGLRLPDAAAASTDAGGGGGGADVHMEAADAVAGGTDTTVAERLAKRVATLTDDDSEHVRAALAMVATELAPVLGKDGTITHLLPPLLLLLRDASSEVRLNLISSLSPLNDVIGVDLLSQSLLPAIVDLSEDSKWRIRLAIIKHIPLLAKQLGEEFFSEKLSTLCVAWLGDDISSIRQAAATNLMELTDLFGSKWALVHLLPSLSDIRQHPSYLRRLTAVQACALMGTKMDADSARTHLLPMVLEMASDSVPNIRFNVAKALEMMAPVCGRAVHKTQIRPVLAVLVEDPDRDVRYFAEKAIESLEKEFGDETTES